jgi:hypothetical protein
VKHEIRPWLGSLTSKISVKRRLRYVVRKKFILISLLPAGYAGGYVFYLSWAAGFVISKYCGGKKDGRPGRVKSIIIPWRKWELHLHHWFVCFLLAAVSVAKGFSVITPELFYGFLGGLVFQGIFCYSDWHRIIRKKHSCTLPAPQPSPAIDIYPEERHLPTEIDQPSQSLCPVGVASEKPGC